MAEIIKGLIEVLLHPFIWLGNRANRSRLFGARVQVIALIISRNPEPSILLGQSPYHDMWMPPQEGVNMKETFFDALRRCLKVECGLELSEFESSETMHVRSIRHVGSVKLPKERHGERPVAGDVLGTPLEHIVLKKKDYWLATILVSDTSSLSPVPDGRELKGVRWFTWRDARREIAFTNHTPKTALLLKCLEMCENDLRGATKH